MRIYLWGKYAIYKSCLVEYWGVFITMPAIVVYLDEGNMLHKNLSNSALELMKMISDDGALSEFASSTPSVNINGLVILTEQNGKSKVDAPKLTDRQSMVLQCLANALSPEQTAIKLGISENTVRLHITNLKKKFNTDSRDQLMAMAGRLNLCDPFLTEPFNLI
jgi:DNA-binding CsgD family transcriptional regulator